MSQSSKVTLLITFLRKAFPLMTAVPLSLQPVMLRTVPYHHCSVGQRQKASSEEQNEGCWQPSASSLQASAEPFEFL